VSRSPEARRGRIRKPGIGCFAASSGLPVGGMGVDGVHPHATNTNTSSAPQALSYLGSGLFNHCHAVVPSSGRQNASCRDKEAWNMKRLYYTRRQVCQLGLSGLAGLTLLDLAGCGGAASTGGSETLQLSFWGDASRNKLTRKAITSFQQIHPNITIHSWFTDFNSYFNKLNTQIAGGSAPDLIQMDMAYVAQYVNEHILLDLTSLVSNKTIDLSDFEKDQITETEDNGKLYGISLGGNYECMIYDTQLVQQAGLGDPPAIWTWDDFATYAGRISKALASQKIYGTGDYSGAIDVFEIWVRQQGRELYTSDGKVAFTPQDAISWFTYWNELRSSGACAPAELQASVTSSGPAASLLVQGKAAFAIAHSNQFDGYQVVSKDKFALQLVPTGPQPGIYNKPSMLMSIAAKSKYADDAASFINFIINDSRGVKALGLDRGIPASARARSTLEAALTANDREVLAYANQVSNSGEVHPKTILDPPGAGKFQTALQNVSQAVSFGKQSATEGGNALYQQALKILG
jgi:multiple sugar transport system substrate-binding protein